MRRQNSRLGENTCKAYIYMIKDFNPEYTEKLHLTNKETLQFEKESKTFEQTVH